MIKNEGWRRNNIFSLVNAANSGVAGKISLWVKGWYYWYITGFSVDKADGSVNSRSSICVIYYDRMQDSFYSLQLF